MIGKSKILRITNYRILNSDGIIQYRNVSSVSKPLQLSIKAESYAQEYN